MRRSFPLVLVLSLAGCDYGGDVPSPAVADVLPAAAPDAAAPAAPAGEADLAAQARALVGQGRFDEARALLADALAGAPGDPAITRLLAALELVDENYEAVMDLARDALGRDPGAIAFHEARGIAAELIQDVEQARADFLALATRLSEVGGEARAFCNPLSQCCRSPDEVHAQARAALAVTYYDVGELDEAERIAREVAADPAWAAHGYFVVGLVLNKRDDLAGATEAYRKVLAACPGCSATWNNLGVLRYRARDLAGARKHFETAYRTAGMDRRGAAIAWGNLADLDVLEGRFDVAEPRYKDAIDLSPRWAGAWFGLAELYVLTGRDDEARAAVRHGVGLDPKGIVRFNTEFIEPEWRFFLDALLAEDAGDAVGAKSAWRKVLGGDVGMLKAAAARHLAM